MRDRQRGALILGARVRRSAVQAPARRMLPPMLRILLIILVLPAAGAAAQSVAAPPLASADHDSGFGISVLLTNYGFAFGGMVRLGIAPNTSFVADASLGTARDEREQEFFIGPFGETITLFKRNHFLMMPLNLGLEQRLFAVAIEDDFRPFLQTSFGPVIGYQWPYFDDLNQNGIRESGEPRRGFFDLSDGEFRLGLGGALALGAYFGEGQRAVGVRIGYSAQYFFEAVDLLELRAEIDGPSRQYFGTPTVSLHLMGL
jgi:hypothetical protein